MSPIIRSRIMCRRTCRPTRCPAAFQVGGQPHKFPCHSNHRASAKPDRSLIRVSGASSPLAMRKRLSGVIAPRPSRASRARRRERIVRRCLSCWRRTYRAASTTRNSSSSAAAMRPRSAIRESCKRLRPAPNGRIAIAFVEWAGANSQKLLIDWTLVRDGDDTKLFVSPPPRSATFPSLIARQ